MRVDPKRRYEIPGDFFSLNGNVVMKLSAKAALGVCEMATQKNLMIARIEGGIWRAPGFEARLDCIWDSNEALNGVCTAMENNLAASKFIRSEQKEYDVFIITIL